MDCVMYTFQKFAGGDKTWNVKYTPSTNVFKCSCQMFETIGIPCCHTFSVMKAMNQHHIPETLIMQRWTRNVKDISEVESSSTATTPNITQIARYGALSSKGSRMSYYASLSTEGYNEANVAIDKLTIQMKGLLPSSSTTMEENVHRIRTQSRVQVKDPVIAATKGPVVSIDATHLTGSLKGVLLIASAKDGDSKIYPLAFGFAASECKGSWTWFLSELKKGIGSPQDLVIVSDRHRGIISAMNEVFPYAQHAFCVFHIAQKFRRSSKNQSLAREFFYNACYQHRRDDCDIDLQQMAACNQRYYNDVMKIGVDKFTNAYCPKNRYQMMSTQLAESMNSALLDLRKLLSQPLQSRFGI
ncbi:hypothetical protein LWI29_018354 [Acer saccharum]|uniref:SWIM-type domain-containing protein n=1 Tax=Acer saccharum TaxID=4024 RepID=A0AA39RI66_ACESA|nr:hypothetical protein LWI29_018354 [Acer saccharum]